MNKNTIEGKWAEIKGEIRKTWGTVTGDELESAKGSWESLLGSIQRRVGHTQDDVKDKLRGILRKFDVNYDDDDTDDRAPSRHASRPSVREF